MKVVISAQADRDLHDILGSLAEESVAAAIDLTEQFMRRLDQLERIPFLGRSRSDLEDGLRGLLVSPYIIFYSVSADHVFVVRILHGKRDLRRALDDDHE